MFKKSTSLYGEMPPVARMQEDIDVYFLHIKKTLLDIIQARS